MPVDPLMTEVPAASVDVEAPAIVPTTRSSRMRNIPSYLSDYITWLLTSYSNSLLLMLLVLIKMLLVFGCIAVMVTWYNEFLVIGVLMNNGILS